MDDVCDLEVQADQLLQNLVTQLELHEAIKDHRSFGHLNHLIDLAKDAQLNKKYRDPLFFVNTPRWLGEWGNTPLEEEIYSIACEINRLVFDICGGVDRVNAIRTQHNNKNTLRREK